MRAVVDVKSLSKRASRGGCVAGVVVAFLMVMAGVSSSVADDGKRFLRVAVTLPNYIERFDPNQTFLSTYDIVLFPLFDKLMMPDREGRAVMRAAKSVTFSEDGRSINIKLRDDMLWSDGQSVVAGDFVRGLQRAAMAKSHTVHLMSGIRNSERWAVGDYSEPLGLEALDDRSIAIFPSRPFGYDITNLMNMHANPYPQMTVKDGALVATNGPYMIETFGGDFISLVRNPFYSDAKPYFDRIEFIGFSHDKAIDYFISNKADVLLGPLGKQKRWLIDRYGSRAVDIGLPRKYIIVFAVPSESTPPALMDAEFRRALYFALDHESFERTNIFVNRGERCGFIPAALPCSEERKKLWRFDVPMETRVRDAKEVVKRAGYGPDHPLKLTLVVTTAIHGYNEIAAFVKSSWHEIGVDVEMVEAHTYTDAVRLMRTGKYNMVINSFYQLAPHQYIYRPEFIGDWTFGYGPRNENADDLVLRASRSSGADYADLVFEAERQMVEAMTMMPLVSDSQVGLYAEWLTPNQGNVAKLNLRYFTPK